MRKLVNGKVVDIDNMELFELAQEGLAMQRTTMSVTSSTIPKGVETNRINKIISLYDVFYKAMAYPLYAIELDIKYATLGNFIRHVIGDELIMWVDNGLYIVIDINKMICIHVVNNTWAIKTLEYIKKDNINMENFIDSPGFEEYTWLLGKVKSKDTDSNYYKEFMPKFVEACNNQPMIIKWELENILNFANVPTTIEIEDNSILDVETGTEFNMDIYPDGYIDTGETRTTWNIGGNNIGINTSSKMLQKYAYDVYRKDNGKMKKSELAGMVAIFYVLCTEKSRQASEKFPIYRGYISGNNLIFEVDNTIYISKSNRVMQADVLAVSSKLHTIKGNTVYIYRKRKISSAVDKISVYSCNLKDRKVKLCKTTYTY